MYATLVAAFTLLAKRSYNELLNEAAKRAIANKCRFNPTHVLGSVAVELLAVEPAISSAFALIIDAFAGLRLRLRDSHRCPWHLRLLAVSRIMPRSGFTQ